MKKLLFYFMFFAAPVLLGAQARTKAHQKFTALDRRYELKSRIFMDPHWKLHRINNRGTRAHLLFSDPTICPWHVIHCLCHWENETQNWYIIEMIPQAKISDPVADDITRNRLIKFYKKHLPEIVS